MYEEDMMELMRKIARREELKTKLDDSCNARKAAKERGDEKTIMRERIRESQLMTFIQRMNEEIHSLSTALGVDAEGMGASELTQA